MQFITSWERKGIIKGRAEGRVEGRVEGRAEGRVEGAVLALRGALLNLSQKKFSKVPSAVVQQVEAISSQEELEQLLDKLIYANSFAEMGLDGARK